MTILIVEDDHRIADFIKRCLEMERYTAEIVNSGEDAIAKTDINDYDVIILDIMLPKMSGLDVCRKLREQKIGTPVIMLTAKEAVEDRIEGLDAGADDYVVKPFAFNELLARVRAVLRREKIVKGAKLQVGDLVLNPATHEVHRGEREITLSSKEYKVLDYMMRRPGQVCTRTMIGEHVWGYNFMAYHSNLIDSYMSYLRKKIDANNRQKLLHTIRDVGYKIQDKRLSKFK
jgi:DNA-binding response OmpR family regulator